MGELNRDRLERQADGLHALQALYASCASNVPASAWGEVLAVLEQCAGTNDSCPMCEHQVECSRVYDELAGRVALAPRKDV